jgi:hypothetical protein
MYIVRVFWLIIRLLRLDQGLERSLGMIWLRLMMGKLMMIGGMMVVFFHLSVSVISLLSSNAVPRIE